MVETVFLTIKKNAILAGVQIDVDSRILNETPIYKDKKTKEFHNAIKNYYSFWNKNENKIFVEEIYTCFLNNSNDFFKIYNVDSGNIFTQNEKILNVSVILFKAFTNTTLSEDQYGINKNSDKVLNIACLYFESYIVYYNFSQISTIKIRVMFFKLITFLVLKKFIKEQNFINKSVKKYKYIKVWCIEKIISIYAIENDFNLLYYPPTIIVYGDSMYIKGLHFSKVYQLCIENFFSGDRFIIKNMTYLQMLINRKLYLDVETMTWIKDLIEKEYSTSINKLHHEIRLLNTNINDIFINNNWNVNFKENLIELQKDYSKKNELLSLLIFLSFTHIEEEVYLIPFFDFRGRSYINSIVGPTTSKIARFFFHYGYYTDSELSVDIEIERIRFFKDKIKNFCIKNSIYYHDRFLSILFWLFIGIGKHLIEKSDIYIEDEIFIINGMSIVEKGVDFYNFKLIDKIEIKYYIKNIYNLGCEKIRKRVIMKDATASVYQIMMSILGPKNQKSLEYVNLGNTNFYVDTYSLQIKLFWEYLYKKNITKYDKYKHILIRKWIKKTSMTIPYNAGFDICYEDFKKEVSKDLNNYDFNEEFKSFYRLYYNFIKKKIEIEYLYKNSSKDRYENSIKEFEKNRFFILESESGKASIGYNKTKQKSIDVYVFYKDDFNLKKKKNNKNI